MLPPMPLASFAEKEPPGDQVDLWLIPLVDDRYFFQFAGAMLEDDSFDSWADLALALVDGTGIDISALSDLLGKPSKKHFNFHGVSSAMMLDAIAVSNIGMFSPVVQDLGTTTSGGSTTYNIPEKLTLRFWQH